MKILFVSAFAPQDEYGGAERVLHTLARGLSARHEVSVASLAAPSGDVPWQHIEVPVPNLYHPVQFHEQSVLRRVGFQVRELHNSAARRGLAAAVNAAGAVDVVNTHNIQGLSLDCWAELARHAPVVHSMHDYKLLSPWQFLTNGRDIDPNRFPHSLYLARSRRAARPISAFVAPSDYLRGVHARYGMAPDCRVIWHGVDVPAGIRGPPAGFVLFLCGQLIAHKGILAFVRAVLATNLELQVRVSGSGPDAVALQHLADHDDRLVFLGRISREALHGEMAAATAVVVPSQYAETFSLVTAEALAAGVPVLHSGLGAPAELVKDGETGFTLPALDAAAMNTWLGPLVADPSRLSAMRATARSFAEQHLTIDRMVGHYEALFSSLASK